MYQEKIVNIVTGETTWRNYTSDEIAEVEKAQADAKLEQEHQAAKAQQRAELFERLGLTEEEAKLLLG